MEALLNSWEIWKRVIVIDFLRYFIPASVFYLTFWVILKKHLAHKFIQSKWPSAKKLWGEFKYSISTVIIFAFIGVGVVTAKNQGHTMIYNELGAYGYWYLPVSFVIMVVFHDFYFYWTHRWMHHPKIYRHVHKVHHHSTNPSPWAAYSFHPLEAVVQALVFPILVFTIPVHPRIAFLFLLYMILRNVWGHLGYEFLPAQFIKSKWLNWNTSTTHHNLHHEQFHSNYGLYFTWWDKLMKTEHRDYKQKFTEVASRSAKKQVH